MVMTVEEFTLCFDRALQAVDVNAIGALDARLREVVEYEIGRIDGDIVQQRMLADKLTALNDLYKQASEQLQRRREIVEEQRGSLRAARAYNNAYGSLAQG